MNRRPDETPARYLRRLRIDAGMTQEQLAERAGLTMPAISRAERGAVPRPATRAAIAKVFGLKASDIWPPER